MSALSSDRAAQINEAHRAGDAAALDPLEHYYRAGVLLNEQKAELPHGAWLPWLEENFEGDPRTAQRYMRLADNWLVLKANATHLSHLTLSKALLSLTEPKALEAEKKDDPKDFLPGHGFVKMTPPDLLDNEKRSAIILRDPRPGKEDVYLYGTTESTCTRPLYADGVLRLVIMDGWPPLNEWWSLPVPGNQWEQFYLLYFKHVLDEPWHRLPTRKDFPPNTQTEPTGFLALRKNLMPAIKAAEALVAIRDKRLYRGTHATFEDYCQEQHDLDAAGLRAVLELVEPESLPLRDAAIGIMCERNLTFDGALEYIASEFQKHLKGAE